MIFNLWLAIAMSRTTSRPFPVVSLAHVEVLFSGVEKRQMGGGMAKSRLRKAKTTDGLRE